MGDVFNLFNWKKVLNFSAERFLKEAGDLFIYEGDYEGALLRVGRALSLEPEDTRALVLKADILFCLGRDIDALDTLNRTLKIDPDCLEALISKASVLDALGNPRDALDTCNRVMTSLNRSMNYLLPSLYDLKLGLLIRLRRFRQASHTMRQARQTLPKEEFFYLANCYQPQIEQRCRERGATVRERANRLSLRLIAGSKAAI